jgi:bifunctional DNA-binding transcriptional regulator/antitoxin component of YhaV-PrlF toxin-antitoxin module
MPIVTVKNKYQVVIPQGLRKQVGVNIGDILEAKVERGKITFTPKTIIDRDIAESLADYKAGRFYGPFDTADEAIASLKSNLKKRSQSKKHK